VVHPEHERLVQLARDGGIAAVLSVVSLADLADAWCAYHERGQRDGLNRHDDPDWWAVEAVLAMNFGRTDDPRRRAVVLALVDRADSEYVLQCIGAGPLEDYVEDRANIVEWIEQAAARSPKFRRALGNVWCADDVSAETLTRFDRAAGVKLARPKPSP
jgi:hypothetical protein